MFKNILLKCPLVISVVLVVFAPLAFSSPAFAIPAPGSDCSSLVMGKSYANSFSGLVQGLYNEWDMVGHLSTGNGPRGD